ncbi:MAG TPA: SDR family oxidoreductase [Candidatus Dormibacteraeota bacterium]|nr:SDR family oxidoreductase [Candidatus Dormibacteraeota bacterium]
MDLGLEGTVALVTGATRGIGLAIARALAAEGARVAVAARTREDVERVATELDGIPVVADLTTEEGCRLAVERAGEVRVLVNNLGLRAGSSWSDTGVAEMERAMAGNLYPAVRLSLLVLPGMRRAGWGRIVVISSIYGREAGGPPAYNAAKAAEISFVTSLARTVARDGITVNCVAPGSILFEGGSWHRRQQADPEGIAAFVERELPLGRFGTPEEVGEVVTFLCSRRAGLVNGVCLPVDGGQSRSNI